jgi:hypothetical protein
MDAVCFCGCGFSFPGDLCASPACGEYVSLSHASEVEEKETRAELDLLLMHGAARSQSEPSRPPQSVERAPTFVPPSPQADTA